MRIENAGPDSFERVRSFYHSLIDERNRRGIPVRLYYENTGWTEFELLEISLA